MNDSPANEFDLELRRRMAVAFSTAELSHFADGMGVPIASRGSVDLAARALVRAVHSRAEIDQLIARLREHKPLFEWPDPPAPVEETGSPAPVSEPEQPAAVEPTPARDPAAPGDGAALWLSNQIALAEPIFDFFRKSAPADPTEAGAGREPPRAPSLAERARAALRLVPGRAASLIGLGIALGALLTWLSMRPRGAARPAASIAKIAAEQLGESIAAVASACGADDGAATNARGRLRRAFDRCSAQVDALGQARSGALPRWTAAPLPSPAPLALPPTPALPGGDSCLQNCNGARRACRQARCGPEPSDGAAFLAWQRCQERCLVEDSRCRLACR